MYENSELVVTGSLVSEADVRLSRFNFGRLLNDKNLIITSVTEFRDPDCKRTKFKLLVSLGREHGVGANSFLLLVDVRFHTILKCVECPFQIVCIEPIATGQIETDQLPFSELIQQCNGLLALGTATGVVYFLDLQLDIAGQDANLSSPTKVKIMTPELVHQTTLDISYKRMLAHVHDQLVCVPLNIESQYKGQFVYQESQGGYEAFALDQVEITALKYFFQTNTLYIGFSFGGFQGWSLQTMKIVFGCCLADYLEPVVGFSLQEPEDDPRNYCYLWVMRGCNNKSVLEYKDPIYSNASLFVFEYEHKEWINNYGYLHSGLLSEGIRFEYYMTATPYSANADAGSGGGGSMLISYGTVQKGSLQAYRAAEEENGFYDTSLFYFIWEAFDTQFENSVRYLSIFDLNQWYQSQMPNILQVENASSYSPYICFYKLSKITSVVFNNPFLDIQFDSESLQRYKGKNFQNDVIYYPCSLSFKMRFLTQDKLVHASFLGLQNKCLSLLRQDAQNVLIEPVEFLNRCFFTGILASDLTSQLNTLEKRREAVLTLALENNELPVLLEIIENWAEGEYDDAGCSCKFFLAWLWKQVIRIKESIDELIVPIFDESADSFDNSTVDTLRAYQNHLKSLQVLLKSLTTCGVPNTEQGEKELLLRHKIVQFILDYLSVIIWLYHSELLQVNSDSDINWTEVYERLNARYESKRKEVREKDPTINLTDALLIDGLVKHTQPVTEMWREHGSTGSYPPSNLHSMVSVYLVDSLSLEMKNQFMLYHLYDLVSIMSEMNIQILEKIQTFPLYFGIQPDLTKLVEAMFALDHDQVEMAIGILQKPCLQLTYPNEMDDYKALNDELQVRIVRQLLTKGYAMNAFRFMRSSLFSCDSLIKQKLYIKTLMRSQNILAAFEFQKKHRNQTNGEQLLYQFYFDCEELKLFDKLFMFKLDQIEEESLICYLMEISKSYKSKLLLIVYFVISEKPFDSARIIQNIESEIQHFPDDEVYSKAVELIKLVQAYQNVSPPTLVQLSEIIGQLNQNKQPASAQPRRTLTNKKAPEVVQVDGKQPQTSVSVFVAQLLKKIEQIEKSDEKCAPNTPFTKRFVLIWLVCFSLTIPLTILFIVQKTESKNMVCWYPKILLSCVKKFPLLTQVLVSCAIHNLLPTDETRAIFRPTQIDPSPAKL